MRNTGRYTTIESTLKTAVAHVGCNAITLFSMAPSASGQSLSELNTLFTDLAKSGLVKRVLELARDEDLGIGGVPGDITSLCAIKADAAAAATVECRAAGIVAGLAAMPELLGIFAPHAKFEAFVRDGDRVSAKAELGLLSGPAREVLGVERPMLNLL